MKTILQIGLTAILMLNAFVFAQSPQKFNYQGVARNGSGNPLASTTIGLRLSITDGSTTLYAESFSVTTNSLGLFNVQVGGGTVEIGDFTLINWGMGTRFIKVEMDPAGGTSYTDMGSMQLVSVPYSLYSEKTGPIALTDLEDVDATLPVLNQVLQWNGTEWVPANISSGGGDNWGSQTVNTNADLTGNGTSGNPLTLSQQGATTGQVLKWNGIAWAPATVSGDNWGTSVVNTSSQFTGNGTSGNPLILAQQGAAPGENLEWSGISWIPAVDDTLRLPYDAVVNSSNTLFGITNVGSGISIKGINTSSSANATGVVGQIQNSGAGAGSSGVIGVNTSTNANGYGVYGSHQGGGTGTYGSSATGIGVYGVSVGTGGIGVLAQGNAEGVKGTTNSSTGYGVHGVALSGGYGGYFEGKSAIYSNSNGSEANLLISETESTDYARLRMGNATPGQFWEINALTTGTASTETLNIWNGISGPVLTIKGNGNVGIGTTSPVYKLHVNGNLAIAGPFMPFGNAGTTGQILQSNGSGTAPSWVTPANVMYANTYMYDGTGGLNLNSSMQALPGLDNLAISSTSTFKLLVNYTNGDVFNYNNFGGGDANVTFQIVFKDNLGNPIKTVYANDVIHNGKHQGVSLEMVHGYVPAGSYTISVYAGLLSGGDTDVYVNGGMLSGNWYAQQLLIQVIPQ